MSENFINRQKKNETQILVNYIKSWKITEKVKDSEKNICHIKTSKLKHPEITERVIDLKY